MIGLKIHKGIGKSLKILLLLLFLGYYGGITLFPHSHVINGITIIHSHPYKSDKSSNSPALPHTGKELLVIQLLSELITTAFSLCIASLIIRTLLQEILVIPIRSGYSKPGGNRVDSLRAPPSYKLF